MAKNKIVYNGNTLIDLTGDTVTADKLMQGYTAHDRSGALITGTATGGGASNIVEGTFTTGDTVGGTNINIPYSGTGYPISCIVVVEGGAHAIGTPWYDAVQEKAVGQWTMTKSDFSLAPTYTAGGVENEGVVTAIYKSNSSLSDAYSRTSSMKVKVYNINDASASLTEVIKLKRGNILSYYVKKATSYGLHPNMTYRYIITYSS